MDFLDAILGGSAHAESEKIARSYHQLGKAVGFEESPFWSTGSLRLEPPR
jgi:hypothetical protein